MQARLTTDTASGLFVLLLGLFAISAVGDLDVGTAQVMGPGFVPRALAWTLIACGLGMTAFGLRGGGAPLPPMMVRPVLMVSLSVTLFGLLVDSLGIVIAVVISTVVASLATPMTRHRETPLVCLVLALMAVFIFVKGLGLAIPIWPR